MENYEEFEHRFIDFFNYYVFLGILAVITYSFCLIFGCKEWI